MDVQYGTRTMEGRLGRDFWLAVMLVAGASPALRGEASVALRLPRQPAYVNEAVIFEIQIANFQHCDPPELPTLDQARLRQAQGASDSHFTQIINGRITERRTRTYTYELTPLAVGTLVIPPIPVRVDGTVRYTAETKLEVQPSNADELFAAEIFPDRQRIFVGQRVKVTMRLWVKPARIGYQQLTDAEMLRLVDPVEFGPFPHRASMGKQTRPGSDPPELFYTYDFDTEFIADRPGPLSLDNIEIGIRYPARQGARYLRTRPQVSPIEVRPIPIEGRPSTFNDAVGLYDIEASASPTQVRVGDPLTLVLEVFGDGPVETLKPPLLAAQPKLVADFRVPDQPLAGEMHGTHKRFTVTIRAQRDDVTAIPPIEYAYFDPDAERFVVARSDPIPIHVEPAAVVEAPEVTAAGASVGSAAATPLEALDGLHDIETSETVLLATTPRPSTRFVTLITFAPAAVFLLVWAATAFLQSRSADPARRRRSAALRHARQRIAKARHRPPQELAVEIVNTMAGYLADRSDKPPARFTGGSAAEFLRQRGVRDELVEQWTRVIERCEEASFAAGAQADGETLGKDALACLTRLERVKL